MFSFVIGVGVYVLVVVAFQVFRLGFAGICQDPGRGQVFAAHSEHDMILGDDAGSAEGDDVQFALSAVGSDGDELAR